MSAMNNDVARADTLVLELRDAVVGYQAAAVLDEVNLRIHAGDFVGLAGANGSGKTTLLKSLLGVLPLRRGSITRNFPRANLGYVPQTSSLDAYFPVSVSEVVAMGTYGRVHPLKRFPGVERARINQVLEQVGLAHLARMKFFNLSGGQQQRVLIARALAVEPVLLLLDEPLSGVDQESRKTIVRLLGDINCERHLAVVISSHDEEVLEQSCQTMVLVSGGRAQVTDKRVPVVHDDD